MLTIKLAIKRHFAMPPQITFASALPGKTGKHENRIFTQNVVDLLLHCQNSTSCLIYSIFLTHNSYAVIWLPKQCVHLGAVGGMVQEKESRERCSSWTVLHAQCTSALSSEFPLSQGNAEELDRWGGKTKHRLISYFRSNISAKNYQNRIVYVKIIASQRWDVSLRDTV